MTHGQVCVTILNWNGKELLQKCLDSIFDNTHYGDFEVVVVDNGSTDGSAEMIKEDYPDVELLRNERNLGFSIGNNQALYKCDEYDKYLLLNNDTKVHSGWLKSMLNTAHKKDSIGIVGAKLLYPDGTIQHAGARFSLFKDFHIGRGEKKDKYIEDKKVDYVTGAAFLIDSIVIDNIGYLDEIFTPVYCEEMDYCQRAKAAGFEIYYSAEAVITHYESKTSESNPSSFSIFVSRKNMLKYALLNEPKIRLIAVVGYTLWKLFMSILRLNEPAAHIRSLKEVVEDLPQILSKRYNRTKHVPSYFNNNSYNYMERYNQN